AHLPDLAVVAGEHLDPPHVGHGLRVVPEVLVRRIRGRHPLHVLLGPLVIEEGLVGDEEAPVSVHVPVVAQVERVRAPRVHVHVRLVERVAGHARLPQLRRVRRVQRRVLPPFPAVVVQPVARERAALRPPYRVAPCGKSRTKSRAKSSRN
ncbi:Os01g0787101, partial [Oryza sativa Japonica Group]